MAAYFVTSIAPGQSLFSTDADPNAVVSAPRGSVALRTDVGNVALYLNTSATTGTVWTEVANTSYDNFQQITLADNLNPAMDIGSTGLLNLLRFITTNGAEQVAYNGPVPFLINTGGLQVSTGTVTLPQASLNLPLSTSGMVNLGTGAVFEVRIDFPATINTNTDALLPTRAGGFRLTDAHVISGGAGGNVQVQTGAAVPTITNMALGAFGAVSRATNVVPNTVYASGAIVRIRSDAATASPGTAYVRFEAL